LPLGAGTKPRGGGKAPPVRYWGCSFRALLDFHNLEFFFKIMVVAGWGGAVPASRPSPALRRGAVGNQGHGHSCPWSFTGWKTRAWSLAFNYSRVGKPVPLCHGLENPCPFVTGWKTRAPLSRVGKPAPLCHGLENPRPFATGWKTRAPLPLPAETAGDRRPRRDTPHAGRTRRRNAGSRRPGRVFDMRRSRTQRSGKRQRTRKTWTEESRERVRVRVRERERVGKRMARGTHLLKTMKRARRKEVDKFGRQTRDNQTSQRHCVPLGVAFLFDLDHEGVLLSGAGPEENK
jgi:hypothetical protein